MKHAHIWRVESPNGTGQLTGWCTVCKMVRMFPEEPAITRWGKMTAAKAKRQAGRENS